MAINPDQLAGGPVPPQARAFMAAVILGIGVIFAGLGTWALFQPLPPSIIGLVLYVLFIVIDFAAAPELVLRGIILRIIIVVALVKAVQAAATAE
jgi:hypothetical protein